MSKEETRVDRKKLEEHTQEYIKEMLINARSGEYEVCFWGAGKIGKGFGKEILDFYGVYADYYCDNNPELENLEVTPNVLCVNAERLIKNKDKAICFLLLGYAGVGAVYRQLRSWNIENIITYDDLLSLKSTVKHFIPFLSRKDTVVYTCIVGGYDEVREPEYISERCDYYLISDIPPCADSIYKWIDIKSVLPEGIDNPIYQNRYCKMNVHKIFPQYRYSIYIDGNFTIVGDISETVDKLKKARIGVAGKNYSDNLYEHALRCMEMGLDWSDKILFQMETYWLRGMPDDVGSMFCAVLVREHNNAVCVRLMEQWWQEYITYTKRDQLSLPYVLWKNGYGKDDVLYICDGDKYDAFGVTPYWKYDKQHAKAHFNVKEE